MRLAVTGELSERERKYRLASDKDRARIISNEAAIRQMQDATAACHVLVK